MDIASFIPMLYEKDTSDSYKNLQYLEALSETENTLYPYMDEFIAMLQSEKYVVRVRGFRLLCKQARWDTLHKIDSNIAAILAAVSDEKPTAVRQALAALCDVVPFKPALCAAIRDMALSLDYSHFKDTMQPLIAKDAGRLVRLIEETTTAETE